MEAGVRGPPGPPAVRLAVTAAAPQEPGNAIAPKLLMVEKLVWDLLQKSNFVLKLAVVSRKSSYLHILSMSKHF